MSAKPESLSGIVRELREDAQHVEDEIHDDDFWSNDAAAGIYRDLADRIEAAAERERAEWRRRLRNEIQINDALATTRPQLHSVDDVIVEAAKERAHEIELAKLRAPGNAAAMRAALERALKWWTEMGNILEREAVFNQIRAALAAPARNCDRYETAEEARRAFEEAHSREIVHNLYMAAFDWLYAAAEGGAE